MPTRRRRTVRRHNPSHYELAKELMAAPVAEIDALSDADFFGFVKLCERTERVLLEVGDDDPQGAIAPASVAAGKTLTAWIDRVLVPRIKAREAAHYAAPKPKKRAKKANPRHRRNPVNTDVLRTIGEFYRGGLLTYSQYARFDAAAKAVKTAASAAELKALVVRTAQYR